ncbi:hypothetical protein BJV78DRAFT_1155894 [Lactifluus subvellereus]|nr:hypothetical protein BJV78DRAFT_1155894 [Lactifluus subvellereus]
MHLLGLLLALHVLLLVASCLHPHSLSRSHGLIHMTVSLAAIARAAQHITTSLAMNPRTIVVVAAYRRWANCLKVRWSEESPTAGRLERLAWGVSRWSWWPQAGGNGRPEDKDRQKQFLSRYDP